MDLKKHVSEQAEPTFNSSTVVNALHQAYLAHHPQAKRTAASYKYFSMAAQAVQPQVETSLAKLDECIKRMPHKETQAFFDAMRHVPHLVMNESDPVRFLRCFDFDADAAAKRLVLYWNSRVELFGERAYWPMTMTSDGALSEGAKEFFLTGTAVFLPNDNEGSTVLCFDPSRRLVDSPQARQQTTFYISQILAENEVSQTKGYVIFAIAIKPRHDETQRQCCRILFETNATKVKSIHALNPETQTRSVLFREGFLPFIFRAATLFYLRKYPLRVHTAATKKEIVADMKAFGISRKGLPRYLGGSWSYRQFVEWLNERIRMERRRNLLQIDPFSAPLSEDEKGAESEDARKPPAAADGSSESCTDGDSELEALQNYKQFLHRAIEQVPQEEKQEFLDAMHFAPDEIMGNECNTDLFLVTEELNCWLAAKRLARYWQLRSETFEADRYKKLDLTGDGALGRMDLATFETGFVQLLPNDSRGRSVLWIESSRVSSVTSGFGSHPDLARVQRCLFYMMSVLAENEKTQEDGAVLIVLLDDETRFQAPILTYINRLAGSLPVLVRRVHLLSQKPVDEEHVKSQIDFADFVHLHVSPSTLVELSTLLRPFGLELSSLPKRLGGQWGLDKFLQWKEFRTRCEWGIPLGLAGGQGDISAFPAIKPGSNLSEMEKSERKRRVNVIHTRRKRDRIRVEQDVLAESITELTVEQARLREENRRLEDLTQSALEVVGSISYPYNSWFPSSGYD